MSAPALTLTLRLFAEAGASRGAGVKPDKQAGQLLLLLQRLGRCDVSNVIQLLCTVLGLRGLALVLLAPHM